MTGCDKCRYSPKQTSSTKATSPAAAAVEEETLLLPRQREPRLRCRSLRPRADPSFRPSQRAQQPPGSSRTGWRPRLPPPRRRRRCQRVTGWGPSHCHRCRRRQRCLKQKTATRGESTACGARGPPGGRSRTPRREGTVRKGPPARPARPWTTSKTRSPWTGTAAAERPPARLGSGSWRLMTSPRRSTTTGSREGLRGKTPTAGTGRAHLARPEAHPAPLRWARFPRTPPRMGPSGLREQLTDGDIRAQDLGGGDRGGIGR